MSTNGYDPNEAQDHTGMVFRAVTGKIDRRLMDLFKNPAAHHCPNCNRPDRFRVIADQEETGLMMLGCECGHWTKPFEVRMPQMDDRKARALGLYVPGRMIEIDLDVHEN